jgi:NAD(P)H-dependent FMN reductase
VPGVLKNALDWIVSSGEFMHKPTAVISASPSPDGGEKANASLVQTLRMMMAEIPAGSILCIPAVSAKLNQNGAVIDLETTSALQSLLHHLQQEISSIQAQVIAANCCRYQIQSLRQKEYLTNRQYWSFLGYVLNYHGNQGTLL